MRVVCLFIIICIALISNSCLKPSDPLPNIIFVLADDLGYGDVGYNGQSRFTTPNIDRMARDGMVFTQHYSGSTVCAPSRSTLLTGLHTGHTPIRGNREVKPEGQQPLPGSTYTLTEMLKDAGYRTGVFGKWGLGFPGSEGDPNMQGVDEFFGYNCQRLAHHYYPYFLRHNQEKLVLDGNRGNQQNDYAPDIIHEQALQFIKSHKERPFFLFYASPLPHAELLLPQEDIDKFKGHFLPEKSFRGVDEGPSYRQGPYGSQDNCRAAFAAMVTKLDDQLGEILETLDRLGIADNTLVIFTSDNGPHQEGGADPEYFNSNGMFRGYKRDLYEGGIRVPMIARWPERIEAGSKSDHVSAFWDVMPTFADILGIPLGDTLDGKSFLPSLLNTGKQEKHEYLYWEFHERGGRIAVRKGPWKGVKYNVLNEPGGEIELYNLVSDPGESTDVRSKYPEIAEDLLDIMKRARSESEVFRFNPILFLDIE